MREGGEAHPGVKYALNMQVIRVTYNVKRIVSELQEEVLAALLLKGAPVESLRLHCCPRDTASWLAEQLPHSFVLNPREFGSVVSVVQLDTIWRLSTMPAAVLYPHGRHVPEESRNRCPSAAQDCTENWNVLKCDQSMLSDVNQN